MRHKPIRHSEWMTTGRLSPYVTFSGEVGGGLSVLESVEPAGDMSGPPVSDLVLIRVMGRALRQTSDFGFGRFTQRTPANAFCLIPPDAATRISCDDDHVVRCFGLPIARCRALLAETMPDRAVDYGPLHRGSFRSSFLVAVTDHIMCEVQQGDRIAAMAAEGAMLSILAEFARLSRVAPLGSSGGLAPWQLRRAHEAMMAQLDGDPSLGDLAAIAGCSPTHFSRAFKQSTGLAPFRWLAERRIEKAKTLLEERRFSLAEVALAVGFSAQPQFTTAFGRATGTTPGRWRRERLS